jgi:hypothetical protein
VNKPLLTGNPELHAKAKECRYCRNAKFYHNNLRCHAGPPQVRFPYDNMSAWPVVPETGGGCSIWACT